MIYIVIKSKHIINTVYVHFLVPISNLTIQKTDKGYLLGNTDNKLTIVCSISGGFPLRNISMRLEINDEIVMDEFERVLNFTIIPKENMHLANVTCRGYDDLLKNVLTETVTLNITCEYVMYTSPSTFVAFHLMFTYY